MGVEEHLRCAILKLQIPVRLLIIPETVDMPSLMKQILRTDHDNIGVGEHGVILALSKLLFIHHALIVAGPPRFVLPALHLHLHIENAAVDFGIDIIPYAFRSVWPVKGHLRRMPFHSGELQLWKDSLHQLKEGALVAHDAGENIIISDSCLIPAFVKNFLLLFGCRYGNFAFVHLCLLHENGGAGAS